MRIRLIAGLGLAAVALLGLTACRSNPTVAAYIGDQTITEDQVSKLIDDHVKTGAPEPDRTVVVNVLVRGAVCDKLREKLGFSVPEPNVPADESELIKIDARLLACEKALPAGSPVAPTEAEAREVYQAGVNGGIFQPGQEANAVTMLMANKSLAAVIGRKRALEPEVAKIPIAVNPKYGKVSFLGDIPVASFSFGQDNPVFDTPIVTVSQPTR